MAIRLKQINIYKKARKESFCQTSLLYSQRVLKQINIYKKARKESFCQTSLLYSQRVLESQN
jgi:hypothetical protein